MDSPPQRGTAVFLRQQFLSLNTYITYIPNSISKGLNESLDIPNIHIISTLTMKLFLDTAVIDEVKKRFDTGLIAGVTTNPTLIKRSGNKPIDIYTELYDMGIPDISMEVVEDTADGMYYSGMTLAERFPAVSTIKLPCSVEGLKACRLFKKQRIHTNVTLIFDASQAILASLAGASYISPFVGRMDDNSLDGLKLIKDIASLNLSDTQILAASIRDPQSVGKAFNNGAHICTLPPLVFDKMYKHVLTDAGIAQFNKDHAETSS